MNFSVTFLVQIMDAFIKHFWIGFRAYGKAVEIIFSNGLWYYFIFPILLNALLFFGGFSLIGGWTDIVQSWVIDSIHLKEFQFFGSGYLQQLITGFIWISFKLLFFFVFTIIGGYIVLILMSPIYALLSEKVEHILTGNVYPFEVDQFVRDIWRGILIAIRNMLIGTVYIIVVFLLGFIPVIGQLGGFFLFIVTAYFYGFSFIDYTNERRKLSIKESIGFMRKYKGMAVANGLVFSLFMLVPFCGYTLAGFTSIISVAAATIAAHKMVDLSAKGNVKHGQQIEG